jgi:hypothetical protein
VLSIHYQKIYHKKIVLMTTTFGELSVLSRMFNSWFLFMCLTYRMSINKMIDITNKISFDDA